MVKLPPDLLDRRVEITGPVDRKMVINALNSGAKVFMADFEDAHSPTWSNNLAGQVNLRDAVRGTIEYTSPEGKRYALNKQTRRPDGPARAAGTCPRSTSWSTASRSPGRCSTSACTSSTTPALLDQGTGPYFYLPKLESHLEARLWNDVFVLAQQRAGAAARDHQGHGADRDDPGRVRDGRDPLRAARPHRRPQLRPVGLHLQLHQEVPQPARVRACPTGPR